MVHFLLPCCESTMKGNVFVCLVLVSVLAGICGGTDPQDHHAADYWAADVDWCQAQLTEAGQKEEEAKRLQVAKDLLARDGVETYSFLEMNLHNEFENSANGEREDIKGNTVKTPTESVGNEDSSEIVSASFNINFYRLYNRVLSVPCTVSLGVRNRKHLEKNLFQMECSFTDIKGQPSPVKVGPFQAPLTRKAGESHWVNWLDFRMGSPLYKAVAKGLYPTLGYICYTKEHWVSIRTLFEGEQGQETNFKLDADPTHAPMFFFSQHGLVEVRIAQHKYSYNRMPLCDKEAKGKTEQFCIHTPPFALFSHPVSAAPSSTGGNALVKMACYPECAFYVNGERMTGNVNWQKPTETSVNIKKGDVLALVGTQSNDGEFSGMLFHADIEEGQVQDHVFSADAITYKQTERNWYCSSESTPEDWMANASMDVKAEHGWNPAVPSHKDEAKLVHPSARWMWTDKEQKASISHCRVVV